jgi:transketolase
MFEPISDIKKLQKISNLIRQDIIKMLQKSGSGHSAGSLGMADVFTTLYFNVLKHDPMQPKWKDRDRLILSNGHICPVWYAVLAESGYFPKSELWSFRKIGKSLEGHPHYNSMPGIENTSGPLGQGVSVAVGMAWALKYLENSESHVYCVSSDGEHNEGQTWEAIMFAAKYKLSNFVMVLDRNNIQISGHTEDIMPLESVKKKYESFNWKVIEAKGNSVSNLLNVFGKAKAFEQSPVCVIANTIPGKGVSFMENKYEWHGKAPSAEEAEKALKELTAND